jgi:hypothetical protein
MANTYLPPAQVIPKALLISDITQTNPMVITVTQTNSYIVGQLIHLSVPSTYGMYQVDQKTVKIIAIDGLDISVNLDATGFDAFTVPPTGYEQPASFAPAGANNLEYSNFTNNVAFQSQGNTGN